MAAAPVPFSGHTVPPPSRRRFDPRAALIALVLLNAHAVLQPGLEYQAAAMGVSAAAMAACGRGRAAVAWSAAYGALLALARIISLADVIWLMAFAGTLAMVCRMLPLFAFAGNFMATTRAGELACALQMARVPSHLIIALCIAVRFPSALHREFRAVFEAMRTRGLITSPASAALHPARTAGCLMVPLIARVGTIADELGNAVISRGADTERRRSSYWELRVGVRDAVLLLALIALLAAEIAHAVGV